MTWPQFGAEIGVGIGIGIEWIEMAFGNPLSSV
jgi:hypothetical protein